MPLKCKPEYINKHDINFFFTDGYYIDGQLFVPYKEVVSAVNGTPTVKINIEKEGYKCIEQ